MSAVPGSLNELKQRRTEWVPWLTVVEEVLRELETSDWETAFCLRMNASSTNVADGQAVRPLLAGATLTVRREAIDRLLKRLIGAAVASGSPTMATLGRAIDRHIDPLPLFKASLCHDSELLGRVAITRGLDPRAFEAVLSLLTVPLLQTCSRQLKSSTSEVWSQRYCVVCGAWPAFAEERGIERTRHLRCGRCGAEWRAHGLSCVYCSLRDHEALVTLVPEKGRSPGVVEACTKCLGYTKVLMRLRGCSSAEVLLEELASVPLDIAAHAAGFTRPSGAGFSLAVIVNEQT